MLETFFHATNFVELSEIKKIKIIKYVKRALKLSNPIDFGVVNLSLNKNLLYVNKRYRPKI